MSEDFTVNRISFWRSWYEQAKVISKKDRAEFVWTILTIAFEDEPPAAKSAAALMAVNLCGPSIRKCIDRQRSRRSSDEPKVNQRQTKGEPKANQRSDNLQEVELEVEGEVEGCALAHPRVARARGIPPSLDEVVKWATPARGFKPEAPSREWLADWRDRMAGSDWRDLAGRDLLGTKASWRRVLMDCWRAEARANRENGETTTKNNFAARAIDPAAACYVPGDDLPDWAKERAK